MSIIDTNQRIIIVGAGLAGSLLACFLGRRGFHVSVYERRPDPRARGFIGGRSINLALSKRGIDALQRIGLADRVLADAVPMRGRVIHSPTGETTFQPYSKNPNDAINSVSRGGLNLTLIEAADQEPNVTLHFDYRCEDVDLDAPAVQFVHEVTGEHITSEGRDLVIGADGAFSAVRLRMQKTDRFDFSQSYLAHGYKELAIPPTADGSHALLPEEGLHIWPRGGSMMIALPNRDGSFTCTCFWPFAGPTGFDSLRTADDIRARFERDYPDAVPLMPTLVEDFQSNPTSSLVTIRCDPWHYQDKVILLGDAAHAIVPFYGQGMNAAFEDCAVFDQCLDQFGSDWARLLPAFTQLRREHADAIAEMAIENFIEMRDRVGSRMFLLGKRVEKLLHRWLPRWFTPLYNMITFSTIPYAEAQRKARRQKHFLIGVGVGAACLFAVIVVLILTKLA